MNQVDGKLATMAAAAAWNAMGTVLNLNGGGSRTMLVVVQALVNDEFYKTLKKAEAPAAQPPAPVRPFTFPEFPHG